MTVVCSCGKTLQLPDALAGQEVICPFCRAAVKAVPPAPAPDDPTASLIAAIKNQPTAAPVQDEQVAALAATIKRSTQENQPLPMAESVPAAREDPPLLMAESVPAAARSTAPAKQPLPIAISLPPSTRPASSAARPAPKPARPKPKTAMPVADEPAKGFPFYYYIIAGVLVVLVVVAIVLIFRSGDEEKPAKSNVASPPPVTYEAPKPAVQPLAPSTDTGPGFFGNVPVGDSSDYEKRTGKKPQ